MSEEEIIDRVMMIDQWKVSGDIYTQNELNAIGELLDLYNKEKEKNKELEEGRKNGTLSDGFHTYNDLYYQRCVLFATICNMNKEISWKSKRHNDGKKCFDSDNWFIVGIDTPQGTYTYHYEIKFWNLFKIKELEKGKKWDGHTEKDVTRLFSLKNDYISKDKIREKIEEYNIALSKNQTIYSLNKMEEIRFAIRSMQELLEERN